MYSSKSFCTLPATLALKLKVGVPTLLVSSWMISTLGGILKDFLISNLEPTTVSAPLMPNYSEEIKWKHSSLPPFLALANWW